MVPPDPSLDTLLDLDGQMLVIDDAGYWVKFVVHRVPPTVEKPHGLDYSLTMHGAGRGSPGWLRQRPFSDGAGWRNSQ